MYISAYLTKDYAYSVYAEGVCSRPKVVVSMIVDTGSPFTVVSLEAMYPKIPVGARAELEELFRTRNIRPVMPKSASGHSLCCYPILLNQVRLDDCVLREFPVYMVTNIGRKLSLLGLDFINCCKIDHASGSDVFHLDLSNEEAYKNFFLEQHSGNILNSNIILKIFESK